MYMIWFLCIYGFLASNIHVKIKRFGDSYTKKNRLFLMGEEVIESEPRPAFFNKNGFDNRPGQEQNRTRDEEVLINIKKFNIQMDLLNKLQNENVSKNEKLELIQEYEKTFGKCKYKIDMTAGGLYDDFLYDIHK